MEYSHIEKAFDDIIETYKCEATKYTTCCPEDSMYAFEHLYTAQLHALESIKQIIISEKMYLVD